MNTCETCGRPLILDVWCVPCGLPTLPFRPETIVPLLQIHEYMDEALRVLAESHGISAPFLQMDTFAKGLAVFRLPEEALLQVRWVTTDRNGIERDKRKNIPLFDLCRTPAQRAARVEREKIAAALRAQIDRLWEAQRDLFRAEGASYASTAASLHDLNVQIAQHEAQLLALSS